MPALDFYKAFNSGGLRVDYTPPKPKAQPVIPTGPPNATNRAPGTVAPSGGSPAPQPSAPNPNDVAYEQARGLYDDYASSLNNQLSDLGRQKDSLLDQIGATYRGLTQSAKDNLEKNLGILGGRQTEVQNTYEASRQNVGRSLIDRQRQQRQAARATGVLPSSYYLNQQNEAGRMATENIAGLNTEERSKLDAIGSAITNAKTDTNTKLQALAEEEAASKRDVVNRYLAQEDMIRSNLNSNSREKVIALAQNRSAMASALDSVAQAFGGIGQNLVSTASAFRSSLNTNPLADIASTLSSNGAMNLAQDFSTILPTTLSSATTNPALSYIRSPRRVEDESLLDSLFA